MEKFIPYEKLSKKERRKQNQARRGSWGAVSPVTRRSKNPRAYNRRKAQSWKKDPCSVLSVVLDYYVYYFMFSVLWLPIMRRFGTGTHPRSSSRRKEVWPMSKHRDATTGKMGPGLQGSTIPPPGRWPAACFIFETVIPTTPCSS